jgi:hypothetical protein
MSRPEVPANRDLAALAPKVRVAVEAVLAAMAVDGWKAVQFDTLRTHDRQAFLFGKGRKPEQLIEAGLSAYWSWPMCPDGKVTKAAFHTQSWHGYGLACDIVQNDKDPWVAPQAFWHAIGRHAQEHGLKWGGNWTRFPDLPHTQWALCPTSPSADDKLLLETKGLAAVWKKYGAIDTP